VSQLPFRQQLEKHNRPEEVRQRLAAGQYGSPQDGIAQEYLDSIERKEATLVSARAEAREEAMIAIAKATSDSARLAARWAMWAAIIATIAIVIATKDQIVALVISWLP